MTSQQRQAMQQVGDQQQGEQTAAHQQ
jgi:hypothetical protein